MAISYRDIIVLDNKFKFGEVHRYLAWKVGRVRFEYLRLLGPHLTNQLTAVWSQSLTWPDHTSDATTAMRHVLK